MIWNTELCACDSMLPQTFLKPTSAQSSVAAKKLASYDKWILLIAICGCKSSSFIMLKFYITCQLCIFTIVLYQSHKVYLYKVIKKIEAKHNTVPYVSL